MKHIAYEFKAEDGLKLFFQKWTSENEKGLICLVHGLGEHSGCYQTMAKYMTINGYSLAAFDIRGNGKSEGKRGHANSYEILMKDIDLFITEASKESKNIPRFLYGNSMGGNLVLNYCLRYKPFFNGVIVSGPWLRLAFDPPKYKIILAGLMNHIFPAFTQDNSLGAGVLYHEEGCAYDYFKDPLVHSLISARLFYLIYHSGLSALKHAEEFKLPLLIMHGGDDKVTSAKASMDFANANEVSTIKIWENFYHVLHNEPQHEEVFRYVLDWTKNTGQF